MCIICVCVCVCEEGSLLIIIIYFTFSHWIIHIIRWRSSQTIKTASTQTVFIRYKTQFNPSFLLALPFVHLLRIRHRCHLLQAILYKENKRWSIIIYSYLSMCLTKSSIFGNPPLEPAWAIKLWKSNPPIGSPISSSSSSSSFHRWKSVWTKRRRSFEILFQYPSSFL